MVILTNKILLPHNFTGKYISSDNTFYFYKNKMWHRYYGPAIIWSYGDKSWWFNAKYYGNFYYKYNQKQFIKNLNEMWLT